MATIHYYYRLLFRLVILSGLIAFSKAVTAQAPIRPFADETTLRAAVFDTAVHFVGKVEKTDRNDAPWITAINRYNGLPKNAHYCASAFYYVHALAGVKLPVKGVGMVRSYFSDAKRIIYRRNARGNQRVGLKPRMMDAVSLFYSHIEGIAQPHFDPESEDRVKCIGFNTTGGAGTRGGCYINYRRTSEIKLIANWITPYFQTIR